MSSRYPLVLVHGLWDDPRIFKGLLSDLNQYDNQTFTPYMPHKFGAVSLVPLGELLGRQIDQKFGSDIKIDLLGFS